MLCGSHNKNFSGPICLHAAVPPCVTSLHHVIQLRLPLTNYFQFILSHFCLGSSSNTLHNWLSHSASLVFILNLFLKLFSLFSVSICKTMLPVFWHFINFYITFLGVVLPPLLLHKCGTIIYLQLSESHHHLTPSNVTSKLTTLPHHNRPNTRGDRRRNCRSDRRANRSPVVYTRGELSPRRSPRVYGL